jgi:hypothetical protein
VLLIYGYQQGWLARPEDSLIIISEEECVTVAMPSSRKYDGYSDAQKQ